MDDVTPTPMPDAVHVEPVTVAITRRADPAREEEMAAWVRAGAVLAEHFPGFLGTGWVRPAPGSRDWHMIYRFCDATALAGWEASAQRAWWLSSAQGIVEHTRTLRRTGIEGWFDEGTPAPGGPGDAPVAGEPGAPGPPPRWKQAVTIYLGFLPLSIATGYASAPLLGAWPLWQRTLVTVTVNTPLMTYLVLPRITRWLGWWLQGRPGPRRLAAGRHPGPRAGHRPG